MITSNLLCSFVLVTLFHFSESCSSALRLAQLRSNQLVGQEDESEITSRATRMSLPNANNFMQNGDAPVTNVNGNALSDPKDQSTLNCTSFGMECAWKTSDNSSLPWYQSELPIEAVVLQVATGTSIPPNGSYAIALTEDPLDPKARAVLESSVIPCQEGPGHLLLNYWSSSLVRVNFCTMILGDNSFYFCTTMLSESEPGPVYLSIPDHNGRPFKMYIIADNFVHNSPDYSGGFVIVDDISYIGTSCSDSPQLLQTSSTTNAQITLPSAILLPTTPNAGINFQPPGNTGHSTVYQASSPEGATGLQEEILSSSGSYSNDENTLYPTMNLEEVTTTLEEDLTTVTSEETTNFVITISESTTISTEPPIVESQEGNSQSTSDQVETGTLEDEGASDIAETDEEISTFSPSLIFILPWDVTSKRPKAKETNEQPDNPGVPLSTPQAVETEKEPFTQNYPFFTGRATDQTEEEEIDGNDVTPSMGGEELFTKRVPMVPFYQRLFNGSSIEKSVISSSEAFQLATSTPYWYQFTPPVPFRPTNPINNLPNDESLLSMTSSTNIMVNPYFTSTPAAIFSQQPQPPSVPFTRPQFPFSQQETTDLALLDVGYSMVDRVTLFLYLLLFLTFCSAENPKIQIIPKCDYDKVLVQIVFAKEYQPDGQFFDWIIVGETGKSECRRKGNGELKYVVELSVVADTCGTKLTTNGIFQNSIRIAQFPGLILQDDSNFTFRCVLGLPEVEEFKLPQVNPTFDVKKNLITDGNPPPAIPTDPVRPSIFDPISNPSENHNSLFNNNPPVNTNPSVDVEVDDSRQAKMAKASNNLLGILLVAFVILIVAVFILILYICLTQYQRKKQSDGGRLNMDTATPTTASPGVTNQDEDGPWWSAKSSGHANYLLGPNFRQNKVFESNKRIPAPRPEPSHPRVSSTYAEDETERAVDVLGLPGHRPNEVFSEAFRRNGNNSAATSQVDETDTLRTPQSYAEWREKVLRGKTGNKSQETIDRKRDEDENELAEGCLTPVRSITEIYRSAETRLQKLMANQGGDNRSESSIEGEYSIPIQQMPMDKKSADLLGHSVDQIRGFGARKLTEQEISRWRQLITTDTQLQTHVMNAKSLEDLRAISELADYRLFFTRTKWTQIMDCVYDTLKEPDKATINRTLRKKSAADHDGERPKPVYHRTLNHW
uniref:MAM domain-containing protein n=1 Tax=Bursaphelenchus xylophilus TaxID=6326 RepID=A0A1I7SLR2_BURXY